MRFLVMLTLLMVPYSSSAEATNLLQPKDQRMERIVKIDVIPSSTHSSIILNWDGKSEISNSYRIPITLPSLLPSNELLETYIKDHTFNVYRAEETQGMIDALNRLLNKHTREIEILRRQLRNSNNQIDTLRETIRDLETSITKLGPQSN